MRLLKRGTLVRSPIRRQMYHGYLKAARSLLPPPNAPSVFLEEKDGQTAAYMLDERRCPVQSLDAFDHDCEIKRAGRINNNREA